MKRKSGLQLVLGGITLCASLLTPEVGRAEIVPIGNPGDIVPGTGQVYSSYTTLLPITVPDFTSFSSLSDPNLTASFSSSLGALTAPGTWSTWSAVPFSERPEDGTIRVARLNNPSAAPLIITLSDGVDVFGFEIEGNLFEPSTFTAEFFSGETSLGSITRIVESSRGARLFAGVEPGAALIDQVMVSGGQGFFAIAQVRYHLGADQVVPEPTGIVLLSLGGVAIAGYVWRRGQQQLA